MRTEIEVITDSHIIPKDGIERAIYDVLFELLDNITKFKLYNSLKEYTNLEPDNIDISESCIKFDLNKIPYTVNIHYK